MELSDYDNIIKHLVAILAKQDVTNRRLEEAVSDIRAFVQQQTVVNTQNTTVVLRISRTLDLIDEKLGQLLNP
jgi:transcriptional regulator NrdR family protein